MNKTFFLLGIFLIAITSTIIVINTVLDNFQEEKVELFITPSGAHLEVSKETGEIKVLKEATHGSN